MYEPAPVRGCRRGVSIGIEPAITFLLRVQLFILPKMQMAPPTRSLAQRGRLSFRGSLFHSIARRARWFIRNQIVIRRCAMVDLPLLLNLGEIFCISQLAIVRLILATTSPALARCSTHA